MRMPMPTIFERSYGVVPFRRTEQGWEVLLVKHQVGHWGFPKGHAEGVERPIDSALRELREETGVERCQLISEEPIVSRFTFRRDDDWHAKRISYFVGIVPADEPLVPQQAEIAELAWFAVTEAPRVLTNRNIRKVLTKAYEVVSNGKAI
jgi:ADP-ribose pyrophosphatase YjhB (NUDIX family)